jgi:hypothetical protein
MRSIIGRMVLVLICLDLWSQPSLLAGSSRDGRTDHATVNQGPTTRPTSTRADGSNLDERLQPADFIYRGAFRLPDEFNWGARGLSYHADGNGGAGSLLVTGFELPYDPAHPGESCSNPAWNCYAFFGEGAIPSPTAQANWEKLPQATLVGQMKAFDKGLVSTVHREYVFVEDLEYVPRRGSQTSDKLYGSINLWYAEGVMGEKSFPTIWFSNLDGTGAQGMFHVGPDRPPYHGRKMGSYLFSVPEWYAKRYLGGRTLLTGRSRGTPATGSEEITINGGSQGPTLFAFHAWDNDKPAGNLDALPILYYRVKFPACAGPNVGNRDQCDYPGFTMCDAWTGAAFVDDGGKRAIVLLGYKGLGGNCYDEPPTQCHDPCSTAHGYHCQPYERQIIFYDVHELGRSALGRQDPWTVLPYAIWRPSQFYLTNRPCWNAGGMAYDHRNKRLFVVERGLGANETNATVVHVWASSS